MYRIYYQISEDWELYARNSDIDISDQLFNDCCADNPYSTVRLTEETVLKEA